VSLVELSLLLNRFVDQVDGTSVKSTERLAAQSEVMTSIFKLVGSYSGLSIVDLR